MKKLILLMFVGIIATVSNANAASRSQIFAAIRSCAGESVGLTSDHVDMDRAAGNFFGDQTPSLYNRFCRPALEQIGVNPPDFSNLLEWQTKLSRMTLANFALVVEQRSK